MPVLRVLLLSAVGARVNPYIDLLQQGLAAAGAEVRRTEWLDPAGLDATCLDVVHLHWLERYDLPPAIVAPWPRGATGLPQRAARRLWETAGNGAALYQVRRRQRLSRLLGQLQAFRSAGGRVVYTVHNLDPHEEPGPADRWAAGRLIGLADAVHVHDASTAEALAGRYGRRAGVAVIPHGHYLDAYPNTISRDEARRSLGLPPQAFVFVTLGLLRPYKGLEELLPAFKRVSKPDDVLLLAGKPEPDVYAQTLAQLAGDDSRILLAPRFVPQDEVQTYLNAADVCVLPYRQITTSGAALLAFSFGLPVIAPAIGAFRSLIAGRRGILYEPADPGGLGRALEQARATGWDGAREEITGWVAQFDWAGIGRQFVELYTRTRAG